MEILHFVQDDREKVQDDRWVVQDDSGMVHDVSMGFRMTEGWFRVIGGVECLI